VDARKEGLPNETPAECHASSTVAVQNHHRYNKHRHRQKGNKVSTAVVA
jgi:hypothetical protein